MSSVPPGITTHDDLDQPTSERVSAETWQAASDVAMDLVGCVIIVITSWSGTTTTSHVYIESGMVGVVGLSLENGNGDTVVFIRRSSCQGSRKFPTCDRENSPPVIAPRSDAMASRWARMR